MRRVLYLTPLVTYSSQVYLEPPPIHEKIRGIYENKIRQNAAPEKIFEVFASIKEGKSYFMEANDFFKAFTAYNYSPGLEEQQYNPKESMIFKLVDANGDGRISFPEYFFFVILLSIGNAQVNEMFQEAGGIISKSKFVEIIEKAKDLTNPGKDAVETRLLPDPRSTSLSKQDFHDSVLGLVRVLFSSKDKITFEDFEDLKELLQDELHTYEFYNYPQVRDGVISAESFAKSIIAYFPAGKVDKYLRRIEEMEFEGEVTFDEFIAFIKVIQNTEYLEAKLLSTKTRRGRGLSLRDIERVFEELCAESPYCQKRGIKISKLQCEVFLEVLDIDGIG
jgi:Ca2+-binding EF-hand superfamily protein